MKKNDDVQEKLKRFDKKLLLWQVLAFILAGILIVWLFLIQVVDIKHYKEKAKRQRNAQGFVLRGEIFDRNGEKLASNKQSFNVYAHPGDYIHEPDELAEKLAPVLGISYNKLVRQLKQQHKIILVKKDVDRQTAIKVRR